MSDSIKHECGIALIRLLKPLDFYKKKYGTKLFALNKMFLMMQKQVNRGQDGAGLVSLKLDVKPGQKYINRIRSVNKNSIEDIFQNVEKSYFELKNKYPNKIENIDWFKEHYRYTGELYLGHLRYGTYGKNNIERCHPVLRENNWKTKNLVVAGNFNMTNVDELFQQLINLGQAPKEKTDTITILEKIGHFTDEENSRLYYKYKKKGLGKIKISKKIEQNLDIKNILKESCKKWDGGYVIAGMLGHGDAFVLRDPNGIRPAYYYKDDEIVVVASERPVIQTAFGVPISKIEEVTRGSALIIRKGGKTYQEQIIKPKRRKACSFERIYFSRGNDIDIYKERKKLGKKLSPRILHSLKNDFQNTVFSFIPNTAEIAFYGMVEEINKALNKSKQKEIERANKKKHATILNKNLRIEKIAIKDAKLRTFITADEHRENLVGHVYDTTYGLIQKNDNLVILDDSIVRGTTLRESILEMLGRLKPKKIIIVSSAPQIRYPDCYGIDMAKLGDLIAFRAIVSLLQRTQSGKNKIQKVYNACKEAVILPKEKQKNEVREIYNSFSAIEISQEIAKSLKPKKLNSKLEIIYQTIEDLHLSCPNHTGDWYFTGKYPTHGGNAFVNKAFIYYMQGKNIRAY
jgi:amidophosphoribosyltransferase